MSGTLNDQQLRKLLLSLPGKAVKILHDEYSQSLLRIAMKLTHDPEVSRDIVQETFADLWLYAKKIGRHHERSIQYYLVRVVRNKSISYYRENLYIDKQIIKFMKGQPKNAFSDSPETQIIRLEMNQEIRDAIAKFPKRECQCLMMRIDEELRNEEIAARLEISVKSVERSFTSAKKRLRTYLYKHK